MNPAPATSGPSSGQHSPCKPPSQVAVDAVRRSSPVKRRTREAKALADNRSLPLTQSDMQRIMGQYHALRKECLNMHDHKTPQLLARNQELLAERVKAIQQARARQTPAAHAGDQSTKSAGETARPGSNIDELATTEKAATADAAGSGQKEAAPKPMQANSSEAAGQGGNHPAGPLSTHPPVSQHMQYCTTPGSAVVSTTHQPLQPYSAEYHARKHGCGDWQQISRVPAVRLPDEERLPEYFSWSMMARNQLAPELPPGTRLFYPDNEGESVPISDDEIGSKPWFCEYGFTHDYALKKLAEKYSDRLDWLFEALEKGLEKGRNDYEVSRSDLKARLRYLLKEEGKQSMPEDSKRRQSGFRRSCKVLHQQYCNRCKVYGCPQHGGGHVLPASNRNPSSLTLRNLGGLPCSANCWKKGVAPRVGAQTPAAAAAAVPDVNAAAAVAEGPGVPGTQRAAEAPAVNATASNMDVIGGQQPLQQQPTGSIEQSQLMKLSPLEEGLLAEGLAAFGPDPCSLVLLLLDRNCNEVKELLSQRGISVVQQQRLQQSDGAGGSDAATAAAKRRKRRGQCGKATSVRKHIQQQRWLNGERCWASYEPCNCVGPCQKGSCSCIDNGNYCEKFCACSSCKGKRDCTFQGCECRTQCKSNSCPCMQMLRECDPLLCKNCAATASGTAAAHECCRNMNLRLNKQKRVQIGLSGVAGWGAFILEAATQGEFIGEYIGELLPQEEADRRGAAYDKSDNSYLFTINRDWVLDARQRGNKLRFANHSSRPNCMTRVLMVDGDYRVGLFAEKDLKPGDELFYNYMYDLDNAPDWALAAGAQPMSTV